MKVITTETAVRQAHVHFLIEEGRRCTISFSFTGVYLAGSDLQGMMKKAPDKEDARRSTALPVVRCRLPNERSLVTANANVRSVCHSCLLFTFPSSLQLTEQ